MLQYFCQEYRYVWSLFIKSDRVTGLHFIYFSFFYRFPLSLPFCFAFVMGAKLLIFTLIGLAISVDGSDDPSKRQLILKHNLKIHLKTWRFVFFKMVTTFLYTSRFVCKNRNNSQNASAENQIAPKSFLKNIFNFLIILV